MSITAEIERYLKDQSVDYEVIEHPAAYTAPQEAAASHVSGLMIAASCPSKSDGETPGMEFRSEVRCGSCKCVFDGTSSLEQPIMPTGLPRPNDLRNRSCLFWRRAPAI